MGGEGLCSGEVKEAAWDEKAKVSRDPSDGASYGKWPLEAPLLKGAT